jgi:hypothetical protein
MLRNAFWFSTGVAATFVTAFKVVGWYDRKNPGYADKVFADRNK